MVIIWLKFLKTVSEFFKNYSKLIKKSCKNKSMHRDGFDSFSESTGLKTDKSKFYAKQTILAEMFAPHDSYKLIILLEKCEHLDLNVFHLKRIIGTHGLSLCPFAHGK